ncbi:MAG: aldo/keto reductase [Burkholderiales bacterium]|nr:aldo/keto reductase [Phycisphaerae bacterium]
MAGQVRWGILGTGSIAKCFAQNLKKSATGVLAAVGSRTAESAQKFAAEHGALAAHATYDALLADPNVDAIYISAPHPLHAEWSIKALHAGKHVICEKPLAINHAQAMAMIEAATLANRALMEAFMYRCHPQTARLVELLKSKAIGDVQIIQATFSFKSGFNPTSRLWANELAGGGIMDVGGYTVSAVRLIAGAAVGKDFDHPNHVSGTAKLAPTGVDEYALGTLKFTSGIVAQVATGVGANMENVIRIFGTEGKIVIPDPWLADRTNAPQGKIVIHRKGQAEEIVIPTDLTSFTHEINTFDDAVLASKTQAAAPAMTWDDMLSQARTLDQWRAACGVVYAMETDKGYPSVTVSGETLTVKSGQADDNQHAPMNYLTIPGLDKKMSRLVLGYDNQQTLSHTTVMNDDFFEKGGNAFDTAWLYGGGLQERLLGQWIKLRGVRDQTIVIVKGCHPPHVDPYSLSWQLKQSLERLQFDRADIYMMHRDNPDVPVGEFVSVMNEHVRAGRIKIFGGSNWTLARVDEANEYARKNGLQGFSVVSNNFSLARMVNPVWAGCVSASDPDSRAWFTRTQTTLLSWSSQARGFFLPGRAAPDKLDDREMIHCWYADDNFQRLERAKELAKKHNVSPINIALAYVLNQPFPTIALFGPRQLNETRTSLPGLTVKLTPDEMKWLNLES